MYVAFIKTSEVFILRLLQVLPVNCISRQWPGATVSQQRSGVIACESVNEIVCSK